jgi:hypothetical protein
VRLTSVGARSARQDELVGGLVGHCQTSEMVGADAGTALRNDHFAVLADGADLLDCGVGERETSS